MSFQSGASGPAKESLLRINSKKIKEINRVEFLVRLFRLECFKEIGPFVGPELCSGRITNSSTNILLEQLFLVRIFVLKGAFETASRIVLKVREEIDQNRIDQMDKVELKFYYISLGFAEYDIENYAQALWCWEVVEMLCDLNPLENFSILIKRIEALVLLSRLDEASLLFERLDSLGGDGEYFLRMRAYLESVFELHKGASNLAYVQDRVYLMEDYIRDSFEYPYSRGEFLQVLINYYKRVDDKDRLHELLETARENYKHFGVELYFKSLFGHWGWEDIAMFTFEESLYCRTISSRVLKNCHVIFDRKIINLNYTDTVFENICLDLFAGVVWKNATVVNRLSSIQVSALMLLTSSMGIGVMAERLIERTYPDEFWQPRSGSERVRKTIGKLRKIGFKIENRNSRYYIRDLDYQIILPVDLKCKGLIVIASKKLTKFNRKDIEQIFKLSKMASLNLINRWKSLGFCENIENETYLIKDGRFLIGE